jgi:hypothetical protein
MRLPAPTDIVMRVDAVTICGTDLHILKGDVPEVRDPGVGDGLPGSRSRAVEDEGLHRTSLLAWIVGGAARGSNERLDRRLVAPPDRDVASLPGRRRLGEGAAVSPRVPRQVC